MAIPTGDSGIPKNFPIEPSANKSKKESKTRRTSRTAIQGTGQSPVDHEQRVQKMAESTKSELTVGAHEMKIKKLKREIGRTADSGKELELEKVSNTQNPVAQLQTTSFIPLEKFNKFANSRSSTNKIDKTGIPILYKKDDLISALRLFLSQQSDNETVSRVLINIIRKLQAQPGDFIEESSYKQNVPAYLHDLLKNQQQYVSSVDILKNNPKNETLKVELNKFVKEMEEAEHADHHPGFALKLGLENHREVLAGIMFKLLGFSKYILSKLEVQLIGANIDGESTSEAIAGEWLEDAIAFPFCEWTDYGETKMTFEVNEFKLREELNNKKQELADLEEHNKAKTMDEKLEKLNKEVENSEYHNLDDRIKNLQNKEKELKSHKLSKINKRNEMKGISKKLEELNTLKKFQVNDKNYWKYKDNIDEIAKIKEYQKNVPIKYLISNMEMKYLKLKIMDAKMEVALAETAIKDNQKAKKTALDLSSSLGGKESIQTHTVIDGLFCSYDSHPQQYMQKDGQWICYDFARFLAPFETFTINGHVYATLRSTFLDHPDNDEPMHANLLQTLKELDFDAFEEQLRKDNRIGTPEEFDKAQNELAELEADLKKASAALKVQLIELQNKYPTVKLDPADTASTAGDKFEAIILERQEAIQAEVFKKVHPAALAQMKERNSRLQTYINSTPLPTSSGAFKAMHPQLAIFVKVLGRFESLPGLQIGYKGFGAKRSLDSIIEKAQKKGLATAEELDEMKKALQILRQNSPDVSALSTTMNL